MSEIVADVIAGKGIIQQLVDTYTPIVSECIMHFESDGVTMRACDPADVAMSFTKLDSSAFESYDVPGSVAVGANLEAIDDRIGVGDAELVNLRVDMEKRKLAVDVGNINQWVAMIDPDAVRSEPDTADLDLPNEFSIEASALGDVVDAAELASDHVGIHGHPDDKRVTFTATGDVDETTIEFDRDNVLAADVTEDVMSLFSLEYVEELAKPIPSTAEVDIQFGDEHPTIWEWTASDGAQETTSLLAPRIQAQ